MVRKKKTDTPISTTESDYLNRLNNWAKAQRREYTRFQRGHNSSIITQDRIAKLSAMGFKWNLSKPTEKSNSDDVIMGNTGQQFNKYEEQLWSMMFDEYVVNFLPQTKEKSQQKQIQPSHSDFILSIERQKKSILQMKKMAKQLEKTKKQAGAPILQETLSRKRKVQGQERDVKQKKQKLSLTQRARENQILKGEIQRNKRNATLEKHTFEGEIQRSKRNATLAAQRAQEQQTLKGKLWRSKRNATLAAQRALRTPEEQKKQNNDRNTRLKQRRLNITEPEKLAKREGRTNPKEREDMKRFKNDNLAKTKEEIADDVRSRLDTLALSILSMDEIKEDIIEFL